MFWAQDIAMECVVVRSKAALKSILGRAEASGDGEIRLETKKIDQMLTYQANCRDAPTASIAVLPWPSFDSAICKNTPLAMERFANFCRSQLGQHKFFVFHLVAAEL